MSKTRAPKIKFNAAAAYDAPDDDSSMGQGAPSAAGSPPDPSSDPTTGDNSSSPDSSSGQPLSFPAEQVAQMEQLKQAGNMAALGQYVAQFLP